MPRTTLEKTPCDSIQRHPREAAGDDPVERWLRHPENVRAIRGALRLHGMPEQDVQDGVQDVFVRALTALRHGARAPADLRETKAFCAAIAKKHAMATRGGSSRRSHGSFASDACPSTAWTSWRASPRAARTRRSPRTWPSPISRSKGALERCARPSVGG